MWNRKRPIRKSKFYAKNKFLNDRIGDGGSPIELALAEREVRVHLNEASNFLRKKEYIQSLIVAKDNRIIFEQYFNGMDEKLAANVHSASKSIWGAALGIAMDQGLIPSLDKPINQLLPKEYVRDKNNHITVKHLITMSSCLDWDEDETERDLGGKDVIAFIVDRKIRGNCKIGRTFNYSTANTQLISAIMQEALKNNNQSTCGFIQSNLFDKIGVTIDKWAFYEQGYFAGGHSLWLSPRELAKFGLLYLNKGKWNGDRIISEEWVKNSTTDQRVKKEDCEHAPCRIAHDSFVPDAYGYLFWLGKIGEERVSISWGYGGQLIYIFEELNTVVVITTNTTDYTYDGVDGPLTWIGTKVGVNIPENDIMPYIEEAIRKVIKAVKIP